MAGTSDAGTDRSRITRRRFVEQAGAVAVSAGALAAPATAKPRPRQRSAQPTVAVFGGGITGLTAAHELAQRGFKAAIYEARAWGGRAHSFHVPGTGSGGRPGLPGEHGIHVYFGVYRNLGDTLRRLPFGSNTHGAFDNLVPAPQANYSREGRDDLVLPLGQLSPKAYTPAQLIDLLVGLLLQTQIPAASATYFAQRMAVHLSSCDARRSGEWEKVPWDQFIGSDRFGGDYRRIVGNFTRILWGSKASLSSADFIAYTFEMFVLYNVLGFGRDGNAAALRAPNGPANEVIFAPWLQELHRHGATLHPGAELRRLDLERGRITAAHVHTRAGAKRVAADWYVLALPVEQARRLWRPEILSQDPQLAGMNRIQTADTPGITFYLNEDTLDTKGFVACTDSPWYVEYLKEPQFWRSPFARSYGNGQAVTSISVNTLSAENPGTVYGKPVRECTLGEFATDVWEQIKAHANKPGRPPTLTDQMLVSWHMADDVAYSQRQLTSLAPVVVPIVDTAQFRPQFNPNIPNLLLAGDYTENPWGITNMEAANYSGRRAANQILDLAGSAHTPATLVTPYQPPEWQALRKIDEQRYASGQSNMFDTEMALHQLTSLLRQLVPSL